MQKILSVIQVYSLSGVLFSKQMTSSIQGGSLDNSDYVVDFVLDEPAAEHEVEVIFDRQKCDAKPISKEQSEKLFATWNKRVALNPMLYDGLKFRLGYSKVGTTGKLPKVTMGIGLTSYARYLGTNRNADNEFGDALEKEGLEKYNDRQSLLSDTYGNGALVITSDHCVPLVRRSLKTGEFAGYWDVPGGHAEPHRLGIKAIDAPSSDVTGQQVNKEFFHAIRDEVRTELNVPDDKIGEPLLFGVLRSVAARRRPGQMFLVHIDMTSDELCEVFKTGGEEAYESTMFALVPAKTILEDRGSLHKVLRGHGTGAETLELPSTFEEIQTCMGPSAWFCFDYYRKLFHPQKSSQMKRSRYDLST